MEANREQFLWVEKYRPQTIRDCILPEATKATFQQFLDQAHVNGIIFDEQ